MTEPPTAQTPPARPTAAETVPRRAGIASAVGSRLAALLLGAACIAWTAAPIQDGGEARAALVIAITAAAAGALRLAFADIPQPENQFFLPGYVRAWLLFLAMLRAFAWEETAVLAIAWMEIQHTARPWHTAALGAGLLAYLLTTHIAESGARASSLLRSHAGLLIAGACLLALGAGFAEIPATSAGAGSAILRVIAAAAVIAATVLVFPA